MKSKIISSDYEHCFIAELNEFIKNKDIKINQLQFNPLVNECRITYIALIIYTEEKGSNNNESSRN